MKTDDFYKCSDEIPLKCPICCEYPFVTFLRGTVARPGRLWYWPFKKRPRYAIICARCKNIVGYEWDGVLDVLGTRHLSRPDRNIVEDSIPPVTSNPGRGDLLR